MRKSWLLSLVPLVFGVACGGMTAEAPLTVPLGLDHDQALKELAKHRYCVKQGTPPAKLETYPRCDRPGPEWGESWVTARYDRDNKLVELRRYERFSDQRRATERWQQLVTERQRLSPATDAALVDARDQFLIAGTKSVKAFRIDDHTVVGVFLLEPTPPDDASILEYVLRVGHVD